MRKADKAEWDNATRVACHQCMSPLKSGLRVTYIPRAERQRFGWGGTERIFRVRFRCRLCNTGHSWILWLGDLADMWGGS